MIQLMQLNGVLYGESVLQYDAIDETTIYWNSLKPETRMAERQRIAFLVSNALWLAEESTRPTCPVSG